MEGPRGNQMADSRPIQLTNDELVALQHILSALHIPSGRRPTREPPRTTTVTLTEQPSPPSINRDTTQPKMWYSRDCKFQQNCKRGAQCRFHHYGREQFQQEQLRNANQPRREQYGDGSCQAARSTLLPQAQDGISLPQSPAYTNSTHVRDVAPQESVQATAEILQQMPGMQQLSDAINVQYTRENPNASTSQNPNASTSQNPNASTSQNLNVNQSSNQPTSSVISVQRLEQIKNQSVSLRKATKQKQQKNVEEDAAQRRKQTIAQHRAVFLPHFPDEEDHSAQPPLPSSPQRNPQQPSARRR